MDENGAPILQLAIWKDKYNRLAEQYTTLLNQNQELEDRLINVVDKIERDKSLLSDEIDHLAEKLAGATNTIDYMKNECARYKSDCMLAVHLLQCQPSFYSSQHLNSLPSELREKFNLDSGAVTEGLSSSGRLANAEKKVVHFSTSTMTFPPTAVFLQSTEPSAAETACPEDDGDSASDGVRNVFLKKVMLAPEYQAEKLSQCPKCGFAAVKYDRCSQTVGGDSSYLSNSRSAPHLFGLDGTNSTSSNYRGRSTNNRRSSAGTSSGDLLIELSDVEDAPISPPTDDDNSNAQRQQRVRFDPSPGVHSHHHQPPKWQVPNVVDTGVVLGAGAGMRREQEPTSIITISDETTL